MEVLNLLKLGLQVLLHLLGGVLLEEFEIPHNELLGKLLLVQDGVCVQLKLVQPLYVPQDHQAVMRGENRRALDHGRDKYLPSEGFNDGNDLRQGRKEVLQLVFRVA